MQAIVLNYEQFTEILKKDREILLSEFLRLSSVVERDKKLNAKLAAQFLGISLSTLYKRIRQLPHKKFGKKLIFSSEELKGVCIWEEYL